MEHKRSTLSAALLVGGTCIGGGMLALPIATGVSGFFPSLWMMTVCWFAMTFSALLLLEVSLWMTEKNAHVITMVSTILGPVGKAVAWLLFLFISYGSLVAYTAVGGAQIASVLPISNDLGATLFILFFITVISVGSWFVGRINTILFTAMIIAYFALVGFGLDEVRPSLLMYSNWKTSLIAIPLLLTSFSFQTLVPSLTPYLKRDAKKIRIAIVGGTLIAFLIYAVWQWLLLGIIPVEGPNGLAQAHASGKLPVTASLQHHVSGVWVAAIAEYFAFFAIVTSFLGIGLGLFDFLSDGLKIKKKGWGNLSLILLILAPTLFFATQLERAFMAAMNATGGYGDTILNGLIPVLMVWVGRYSMNLPKGFRVPGGRPLLVIVGAFFLFSFCMELLSQLGVI